MVVGRLRRQAPSWGLPPLYSTEKMDPSEVRVGVRLFNAIGAGEWFLTEYDPQTGIAFGLCVILVAELGYVSIDELDSLVGVAAIARQVSWDPDTRLDAVMADR